MSTVCLTCHGPVLDTRTGCWECPRGGDDWDCHECIADADHAAELQEDGRRDDGD